MLRRRFPRILGPARDDICYATQNRQQAVKRMAGQCDLVVVVGSTNSSNSVRLVEVALEAGADDVVTNEDGSIEVLTAPSEFEALQKALEAAGLKPDGAEVTMRPESHVELEGDDSARMQKLLDIIEDLDDVQDVYHNAVLSE